LLAVEFTSEPLTLSLARPIDDLLEIVLGPDDPSQPLHLHLEHLDRSLPTGAPVGGQATASTLAERDADRVASVNDVVPAVFVENYKLSLGFTRPRRSAGPVLARIGLVPHESGTRLGITCHAAENEIGGSLTFRAGGASLSVRVGSPNIQDPENIPALVIDAIDLDRDDVAEEIRGAVPGLVGKLRDADELRLAALKVGLDQAGDVARSLGRDARLLVEAQLGVRQTGSLAENLVSFESLAVLEHRAETPHASYEPSFREATPGLGDDRVAPLRFEGGRFRWPLVDVDRLRAFNWARIANEHLFLPQPLELLRALFDSGVEFPQHIDQQPFVVTKTDPNGDAEEPIAYRYPVADWSFEDVLHDVIERLGKDAVR